jgi:PKD repeat protein
LTGGKYAFANVTADHTINVTFKQTPVCVAVAKITADKTSGVDPLAVSLDSAGSTAGVTYKWEITKGGSLVDSATTATYMYSFNAGTYTVKLTVTNTADGGCVGTDSVTITVSPSGEYKPGDADMDGMVDIFDALKVAMYVAGMVNITDADLLVALDVDQNGMVDINDALAIAKFDVGLDCGCVLNR